MKRSRSVQGVVVVAAARDPLLAAGTEVVVEGAYSIQGALDEVVMGALGGLDRGLHRHS